MGHLSSVWFRLTHLPAFTVGLGLYLLKVSIRHKYFQGNVTVHNYCPEFNPIVINICQSPANNTWYSQISTPSPAQTCMHIQNECLHAFWVFITWILHWYTIIDDQTTKEDQILRCCIPLTSGTLCVSTVATITLSLCEFLTTVVNTHELAHNSKCFIHPHPCTDPS